MPSLFLIAICLLALLPQSALADAVSDEQVAIAAQRNGDTDNALLLYSSALDEFRADKLYLDAARVAQAMLLLQLGLDDVAAAISSSEEARRLLSLAGKPERAAQAAGQLGSALKARSEYEQARQCYLDALEIYRDIQNGFGVAGTLMSLGVVAELMKQPEESAAYYSQAGDSYLLLGNEAGVMQSYASAGFALLNAGQPAPAADAFRQALFLCHKLAEPQICAVQQLGLCRALREMQRYDEALAVVENCLAELADSPEGQQQARAHLERGRIMAALGQYEDALAEMSRAWSRFGAEGLGSEQAEMATELIETAALAGRSDLAESYRQERLKLNVSS